MGFVSIKMIGECTPDGPVQSQKEEVEIPIWLWGPHLSISWPKQAEAKMNNSIPIIILHYCTMYIFSLSTLANCIPVAGNSKAVWVL